MRTIIVTGIPGTGKTTLAKELAKKLNFQYIDVNKVIKDNKLSEKYDKKRKSKIVDIKKLNKVLINNIKKINNKQDPIKNNSNILKKINKFKTNNKIIKGIIIDSHLSHYLPKKYVDLCVVTKCNLKILEKRLKKRRYSKKKIRENMDAEIFDVCLNESREAGHKVIVIITTKDIKKEINSIMKKL